MLDSDKQDVTLRFAPGRKRLQLPLAMPRIVLALRGAVYDSGETCERRCGWLDCPHLALRVRYSFSVL